MSRGINLTDHLTVDELEQFYRRAQVAVERSHFQIVWLLAQGRLAQEVSQITGYSPAWIGQIARRYNTGGPQALGDRRQHSPGGQWLLSEEQKARLAQALEEPPPMEGCGTARKSPIGSLTKRVSRLPCSAGGTICARWATVRRFPAPDTGKPTPRPKRRSKKTLPEFVTQSGATYPVSAIAVWVFGEHRIGLLPIVRKVWVKRGWRPVRSVETRYQWLYRYVPVALPVRFRPSAERANALSFAPRMKAALYNQALSDFAPAVGAGSHRSHEVVVPEGVPLLALPPYSPGLQPAEKLGPLTNEPLVNQHFESLAALEAVQVARCKTRATMTDDVRARTLFHGGPRTIK